MGIGHRSAASLAAVILAGCGGSSEQNGELSFDEAFDAGEPCSVLFEIRNQWDPDSPLIEEANERLRSIGCYHSGAERTDR